MNKTKRKIFQTAIKLFAEKGYENTGIEEITAVAGYAKGSLYYHFGTKEDLFDLLLEEGYKLLNNSMPAFISTYTQTSSWLFTKTKMRIIDITLTIIFLRTIFPNSSFP